jgi:hypothetical protein
MYYLSVKLKIDVDSAVSKMVFYCRNCRWGRFFSSVNFYNDFNLKKPPAKERNNYGDY